MPQRRLGARTLSKQKIPRRELNDVATIRTFRNADLPFLARVWVEHWATVTHPPPISSAIIEQALLSRTFFTASTLAIAVEEDETVQSWSHFTPHPYDPATVVLNAICFTAEGLNSCDQLLKETENQIASQGYVRIVAGALRDEVAGYAGLAPLGHGIGIPATDIRTASLLSRSGYTKLQSATRMVANTNPYRIPVSREALQLRRTTTLSREIWIPADPRHASAMAHLDIEQHTLQDHRAQETLATLAVWFSDPEAQVMDCAECILDLNEIHDRGELTASASFLIGSVVQSLAGRRVFKAETCVDSDKTTLIDQLAKLNFQSTEQGHCWEKHVQAA